MRVYRIAEITKPRGPIAQSTLYDHAKKGLIELRKVGGLTVVLEDEWLRYLTGEPVAYSKSRHAA